jgi:predicted  nucleic acid-binding Zn-ribbon protein
MAAISSTNPKKNGCNCKRKPSALCKLQDTIMLVQLTHEIQSTKEQLARAGAKLDGALQRKAEFRAEARALAGELAHAQREAHVARDAALADLQKQVQRRSYLSRVLNKILSLFFKR